MTDEEKRQQFLSAIEAQGRSSPAGSYWHNFYTTLCRRRLYSPHRARRIGQSTIGLESNCSGPLTTAVFQKRWRSLRV